MHRWRLPLGAALGASVFALALTVAQPREAWDADQLQVAARALLAGHDPYRAVAEAGFQWPLYYPLTAVMLWLPLASLPQPVARVVWAALTAGVLGAAVQRRPALLGALLSATLLDAVILGQLSPALIAAAVLPWLGGLWVAKPTAGLALFVAYPSLEAVIGGALLLTLSLAFMPFWPMIWFETARGASHIPMVFRPGGVLLLLALVRWRTSEGRLLAALACVPLSTGLYDALPVFLVPRTRREGLILALCTFVAGGAAIALLPRWHPGDPLGPSQARAWPFMFVGLWLPALWLVLRRRAP